MTDLLTTIALVFVAAAILLFIATELSLPTVPVFIIAGLVVGPFVPEEQVIDLAQWGIALLVFVFGIGIEPGQSESVVRDSYVPAAVQLAAAGILGYAVGLGLGFDSWNAFYLGITAALSSSLVGSELMEEGIYQESISARLAQSIHFLQDLVAVFVVLLFGVATFTPTAVQSQLLAGGVLLGGAFVVRHLVFDLLVRLSGETYELLLLSAISVLVGFIGIAELLGVSIIVGAFAAGVAVSIDFGESQQLLNGVESLRNFFGAIFLVSLGALVSIPTVATVLLAGVLLGLTLAVKPLLVTAALLREGYDTYTASKTGFNLDQVSEWTLIIAIEAALLGRISTALFDAIVLTAVVSMIVSAYTHRRHDSLWRALDSTSVLRSLRRGTKAESHVRDEIAEHIILAGFGEEGRSAAGEQAEAVADACVDLGIELVVIDNDPAKIEVAKRQYDNYVYGDVFDPATWDRAGVERAILVVSTIEDRRISETILDLDGEADTILTAVSTEEALDLLEAGAFYVNVPDVLAAEQLAEYLESTFTEPGYRDALREQTIAALQQRSV